ncbi:pep-cterm sorting domain-containing protein [Anaeramoeba flamelloides]|uniref:Pep-cterm sorting domain-containing protein n=1 Tax=Anaeramoeba flamelloides TaxID=1746091 RepID=A0AAV7Y4L0_9EUKA|nr:pep-cterm sorting domain-containing protein [Anaeramoeba flamelloides]
MESNFIELTDTRSVYNNNYFCVLHKYCLKENKQLDVYFTITGDMSLGGLQDPEQSKLFIKKKNDTIKELSCLGRKYEECNFKSKIKGRLTFDTSDISSECDAYFEFGMRGYTQAFLLTLNANEPQSNYFITKCELENVFSTYNSDYRCQIFDVEVYRYHIKLHFEVKGNRSLGDLQEPRYSRLENTNTEEYYPMASVIYDHYQISSKISGFLIYRTGKLKEGGKLEFIFGEGGYGKAVVLEKFEKIWDLENSLVEDFSNLYQMEMEKDLQLKSADSKFLSVHKVLLSARIGDHADMLKEIASSFPFDVLETFIKWVYSGKIDSEHKSKIEDLIQEIGISTQFFAKKSGYHALVKDLEALYKDETSKDFLINLKENVDQEEEEEEEENTEEIVPLKIHKIVLLARSNLFRKMFQTVKEKSASVNDLGPFSIENREALFQFFYTDRLDLTADIIIEDLKVDLTQAMDYYQLNPNSKLKFLIKNLKY